MTYRIPGLRVYRDEPGEGSGGGGAGTGDKPLSATELKELQASIATLDGTMKNMLTLATQRTQIEQQALQNQRQQPAEEDEESDDDDLTEAELEALPRKRFTDYLLGRFQQHLDSSLKPIVDQTQAVGTRAAQTALEVQAREFANKTPDFSEWADEMMAIAKDHANLPIARIYALAKAENPDKAKKIADAATKAAAEAKEAGENPRQPRRAPMIPSGGGGENKPTKMNPAQAAEAAWADTLARFGNPFE